MTITKHFTAADFTAALGAGDAAVVKQLPGGVSIRITLERDHGGDMPDPEVYSEADIAAWEAGEWTFWGAVLSVWIGRHQIDANAGGLWGIDCVDADYIDADHLASVANEIAATANVPEIVRTFAREMMEAANQFDAA